MKRGKDRQAPFLQVFDGPLRDLLMAHPLGVYIEYRGKVVFANPQFQRLSGFREVELLGKAVAELIKGAGKGEFAGAMEAVLSGESMLPVPSTILCRDGGEYPFLIIPAKVHFEEGDAVVGMLMPLSAPEPEAGETAIELSEEGSSQFIDRQQAVMEKMDAMGRLAGGLAHEMNNILGGIAGYCEYVKMRYGEEDIIVERMDKIIEVSFKASGIISKLLAFSRKDPSNPRVMDVNEYLEGIMDRMKEVLGEEISINLSLSAPLWETKLDPTQMGRVMDALLTNAREAMPDGGEVRIKTSNVGPHSPGLAKHPVQKRGEYVLIEISDRGKGIPEEKVDMVFEPFFTTKDVGEGWGLGLSTVYGIVKQNGGYVWMRRNEGGGTAVELYFPREAERSEGVEAGQDEEWQIAGEKKVNAILVVNDDSVKEEICRYLADSGIEVRPFSSGEDALSLIERGSISPRLLITDVVLPGINGRELSDEVMKRAEGVSTILLSGYYDDDAMEEPLSGNSAVTFMKKPVDKGRFLEKIDRLLTVHESIEGNKTGENR